MSWLTALFHPLPKPDTPMSIELATTDHTDAATAHTPVPEPAAPVIVEGQHPRLFTADPLDAETLERHLLAKAQHRLQGLALRVAAARSRLLDLTAADEALSAAEDARHFQGAEPEAWLLAVLAEVEVEIAEAEAGRKRIEARRRARSQRVDPLRSAVGWRHSSLARERSVLAERLFLLNKPLPPREANPLQRLLDAGLSREQIALIGGPVDPDAARQADREKIAARLAQIGPELAAIAAWQSSGQRVHQHLNGLGFDALIEAAKPVDEVTP